jgi:CheY-like chemotaxis protein
MMDGRIGAESTLGDGSRFWIELPLESVAEQITDKGAQQKGRTAQTVTSSTAMYHYKILYIEDNPSNLRLVEQLIGIRNDIELFTAHDPRLGIDLAEAHQPDLILLDINMPGMDGYQVLEILQNTDALKNTPVIAVTANAMPRDIEQGKTAGFSDYVTKPLQVNNFLSLIDNYLSSNRAELP